MAARDDDARGLDGRSWLALALAAAVALLVWALAERPVPMPDFPGQISGLAFSPFRRGESREAQRFPSASEIRADLVRAATLTERIRVYTVEGGFA
ncbi:MAG: hypothetical protein JO325_17555, partial [Solirubrobacterales bacterium]|nr:hypothetical protein [Solirubrobacterales bacterium]